MQTSEGFGPPQGTVHGRTPLLRAGGLLQVDQLRFMPGGGKGALHVRTFTDTHLTAAGGETQLEAAGALKSGTTDG